MKYRTGYQIDELGRYIQMPPGEEPQIRENPRKSGHYPCSKNIIFEKPPETKEYESAVWNGENWTVVPDFTGREFYNKQTAEKYNGEIELGDVIDIADWTEEKPDGRFVWQYYNDLTGVWEENTVKKAEAEKKERLADLKSQMNIIDAKKIRPLSAMIQGIQSSDDIKAFYKYENELKSLRDEYNMIKESE